MRRGVIPVSKLLFLLSSISFVLTQPYSVQAQSSLDNRPLVVGLPADIGSLDPINVQSATEQIVAGNVFAGLIRMAPGSSEVLPDLAESWSVSEDGLTYTFNLRRGVEFHGGYGEVQASDVRFTFERHMDPDVSSRYRADFALVTGIDTPDDYTVIINLAAPNPGWLITALAYRPGWIVSERAVAERGADFSTAPIGAGPYAVTGYQRGQAIQLAAHESYHGDGPHIANVTLRPIPEDSVAYAALQAGDIDLMTTREGETFNQAQANPTLQVFTTPSQAVRSIYLNTSRPPLDNPLIRQAIAHGIDRRAIVEGALDSTGQVADAVISPATWGYTNEIETYPYDPERALELLAEAGASNVRVQFVFAFQAPYDTFAEVIQAQLAEIGVQVELVGMERVAFNDRAASGNFDITALGLTRPPDPDVYFTTAYHSVAFPPGANYGFYSAADELIEQARSEVDDELRLELVQQILRQIAEDLPSLPIYYAYEIVIARDTLDGIQPGILNDLWLAGIRYVND